jgi:two-component system chemotaxis response regulator CheB
MPNEILIVSTGGGGLASLETVLHGLPEDFPVPVVVAYSRSPGETGVRARLHARCPLPVREVADKDDLSSGVVLLGPADHHLLVDEDHLALSTEAPSNGARPSADVLFESASDAFKARVTAVLLKGEGPDGERGVLAVKRRGGFAVVEEGAPSSDIADKVLPASAIAAILVERLAPRPAPQVEKEARK